MNTGTLYIVATPIGNMEDITLRAIKVLNEVDFIACEDTRKTGNLLKIVSKPFEGFNPVSEHRERPKLISYYEMNEFDRIPYILSLLKNGNNVALVSNAGTPTISDPGFKLVRECVINSIKVVSIPGPSSVISALVSSGLPTDKFLFLGFLPKKQGKREKLFEVLGSRFRGNDTEGLKSTIIFFESPYRLLDSLNDLKAVFGDIEIVICRELTKIHEETWRGKISEAIGYFKNPKGEFVILFNILQA